MTKKDQMDQNKLEKEVLLERLKTYLSDPTHKKPVTRRQFMAAGLKGAATFLAAPSLMQVLSRSAWAQEFSCPTAEAGLPAFINIQLAGGPALFANHLVRGPGGDDSFQYGKLGVGSAPGVERLFSNQAPFWTDNGDGRGSRMFQEVKTRLGAGNADILSNSAFVAVAAESIDDSLDNPHDLTGFMMQAGLSGSLMPYLIAGNSTARFKASLYDQPNYLFSNNAAALESSLGFKGSLGNLSNNANTNLQLQQNLVQMVERLSKSQVQDLMSDSSGQKLGGLVQCAVQKNSRVIAEQTSVDIFGGDFPQLAQIWSQDMSNEVNRNLRQAGLAVSTCLRGLSGSATVVLPGFDYHLSDQRTQSDLKDAEAGTFIARTLLTAKALNRKVFLYISSDGSVSSPNDAGAGSDVNWLGDYFKRGMNYIIAYDPAQVTEAQSFSNGGYADASYQLNHFVRSSDGDYVVGNNNPIGNKDSQVLCAAAVFLNYLSFAGKLDLLDKDALRSTKNLLQNSLPSGMNSFYDYYLRIATS